MVEVAEIQAVARVGENRRRLVALVAAALATLGSGAAFGVVDAARDGVKRPRRKKRKKDKDKGGKNRQKSKAKAKGDAREVVRVAQKYKGAKYKMGGASPRGFDCSGFAWFVYQEATGMDIGRTVKDQWQQGNSVSRNDLSPGDLVFFKNTFERGLSHDGISLGGSTFIHAENEGTGVVVSDLSSGYYDDHYAGARRLV